MKYFANFSANNGTSYINPIKGNNKAQLIKEIREISEGQRFQGNKSAWWVCTDDDNCLTVASGGMDRNGVRYRDDE